MTKAQFDQCRCGALLVEDQRYCLHCGARRGLPRIDYSAFWASPPPADAERIKPIRRGPRTGTSSHTLTAVLGVGVLAMGIVMGIALGPGPTSSPADSSPLTRVISAFAPLTGRVVQTTAAPPAMPDATQRASGIDGDGTRGKHHDRPAVGHASQTLLASEPSTKPAEGSPSTPAKGSPPSTPAKGSPPNTPVEASPSDSPVAGSPQKNLSKSRGVEKPAPATPLKLPAIKHVWLIALSATSFADALAKPRADPYLAKQLVPDGTLISNYSLTASSELANGIALLAGQGVNLDTELNCPVYAEVAPPTVSKANGQAEGVGCVYPGAIQTLPDELSAAGLTWKAYVQNMQEGRAQQEVGSQTPAGVTCRHPQLGATDSNQTPTPSDPYATQRNPFVYFHSLLDSGACTSDDVDLDRLASDLATPANTPNLSWIVPSACDDGSSLRCTPNAPVGVAGAEAFLKQVLPQILATSAYRKAGLILIAPDSPPTSPTSASNAPVGALLLSPFMHGHARLSESFNDFSLEKSLARIFGVLPLGHANDPNIVPLPFG